MKKQRLLSRSRGFTLVELLTVIAIIGILAAILIPTVGTVMKKARITASGSNARQIGQAYNIYALSGPRIKNIPKAGTGTAGINYASTPAQWAQILAVYGGLNDGTFYFVSDDPNAPATLPKTILDPAVANAADADWTANAVAGKVAYTMVVDLPRNAPATTSPIIWTRGIKADGTWDATNSPWGSDGGHIAYLDGHVTWQRSTSEEDANGDLIDPKDGSATLVPLEASGSNITGGTGFVPPTALN